MKSAEEFLYSLYEFDSVFDPKDEYEYSEDQLIDFAERYANQSKWISVKDDKPKDGENVLAIIFADGKYYTPFSCTYSKELGFHEMDHKYYLKDWYKPYNNDVTHWQPLPEPPK